MNIIIMSQNKNMRHLSNIVRVARTFEWRSKFGHGILEVVREFENADGTTMKLQSFTTLFDFIARKDPRLKAEKAALEWFLSQPDDARLILLALSTAPLDFITLKEIKSDKSESYWRKHASAGHLHGARKKGATWLIPQIFIAAFTDEGPQYQQSDKCSVCDDADGCCPDNRAGRERANTITMAQDKSMRHLSNILRVASAFDWRSQFGNGILELLREFENADGTAMKLQSFTTLFDFIAHKDPRLKAEKAALEWFLSQPDEARLILLALSTAPLDFITLKEASVISDKSEPYWRKLASAGYLHGARKKGETWLIPQVFVVAFIDKCPQCHGSGKCSVCDDADGCFWCRDNPGSCSDCQGAGRLN